jgi:uncharacterized membrane protein
MFTRLITFWDGIRSSLWALPLVMVLAACAFASVALSIGIGVGSDPVWYLYSGGAKETPQFLSNLVSSMITMATLAISITMVVLTLAAQQLGPRLIRSFMADRRTQISLGLFVSTVVYLLLVLRSAYGQHEAVANLAVTLGTALVLISVATLLFFVHHLASSIIADNVIYRIGNQLDANIARLLPDKNEQARSQTNSAQTKTGAPVPLLYGGYVQAIDYGAAVEAAADSEASVTYDIRPGHHAVPGVVAARILPERSATDELCLAIQKSIVVGSERTSVQDLEFSVRQLVEIALRALSPGINDPYTANTVIDRLTQSLRKVMDLGPQKNAWHDESGKTRVIAEVSTFDGIVDAAFNQIRQQASNVPAVLIRLAECISQLLNLADDTQRPALARHLEMVLASGRRNIAEADDLKDLEAHAKHAGLPDRKRAKG